MKFTVALQHPVYGPCDELLYVSRRVVFRTTSRRKAKKYVNRLIRQGYDSYDVSAPNMRKSRAKQRLTRCEARYENDIPF
jgi:hypothetical protein